MRQLAVGWRLSLVVEAEGLFNDGVAVVLFSLLTQAAVGGSISAAQGIRIWYCNSLSHQLRDKFLIFSYTCIQTYSNAFLISLHTI
jgi:hypothetical protein